MEGCGSNNMQLSEDLSTYCETSSDPPDPSYNHGVQLSVSDLGNWLNDSLNIQNVQKTVCRIIPSPEKNDTIRLVEEGHSNNFHLTNMENPPCKKFFNKSATFPYSTEVGSVDVDKQREYEQSSAGDAPLDTANQPCPRSVSLPTPSKLVPAMKGSREKLGNPPKKLSVTWAPDVYDPPPSAVSHVPTNKSQRRRSDGKKNGKNKQKGSGKSTRGSKGKDKKQARKHGGSSSRWYKPIEDDEKEVSLGERLPTIADFDVGSPDAFCGSSFLKKSVRNLHFSVAEAT